MKNVEINKINVPDIIRSNTYYNHISFIKNYEDTLQKLFKSQSNSSLTNDPNTFIWEINKDLFENLVEFDPREYGIPKDLKNVVITGPYIRSCLLNDHRVKNTVRKEIYVYRFGNISWGDVIENIGKYTEKENEYIIDTADKRICLIKKKYKSPAHIILQYDYMKRVGWYNGTFYASSMFLIEFQKHKTLIMSKFKDPILNMPYDPLDIYSLTDKTAKYPLKIIESVDLDELVNLTEKAILKLYDSKTLIELCIDKYMKEDHPFILENLEKMIIYLSKYKYKRPIFYYANSANLKNKNEHLYDMLDSIKRTYTIDDACKSIDEINTSIIESIIKTDNPDDLLDYIVYVKYTFNKTIIDKIIKHNSKNIINEIVTNKILEDYLTYYLVLMTGQINLIEKFDAEIAINYLKDIVTNGVYESFVYLLEHDDSIITTTFDGNKNLLHVIKIQGQYEKIIDKIMEIKPEFATQCDASGDSPVIYHSKYNPGLLEHFMKYDIDMTILDNHGNSCLHYLCRQNEPKILQKFLAQYPELINMPNLSAEYPIIIACKNKQEEMFYILKNHGAELSAKDSYGNTAYHYICANSMCIGIIIENTQNYFGLTPKDYCKLSNKYYSFEA